MIRIINNTYGINREKVKDCITGIIFFLSIIIFTTGINFQDNPPSGWYQQFLPNLNNMPVTDIEFIDSLVGFAVTGNSSSIDTNYILKTTNGGDNWFISYKNYKNFSKIKFINDSVGFVCGSSYQYYGAIFKTTNTGESWFTLNTPFGMNYDDMSVLNEDTIWVADDNSFDGGLFRTTNGGLNWTQQYSHLSNTADHIYMYDGQNGFLSTALSLLKTTNGGLNWNVIQSEDGFVDIYFLDNTTGWKVKNNHMKQTVDSGLNWQTQTLPSGGILYSSSFFEFSNVNKDTIWGVGGTIKFGLNKFRGIIWKTTNSGVNWGYQIPDTSISINIYWINDFINSQNGWAYANNTGIHTTIGGNDTTYYTGINSGVTFNPADYTLYQNYPNPFNPKTRIRFTLSHRADAELRVYDVLGKEILVLYRGSSESGSYESIFDASGLAGGIYYYSLIVNGTRVDTKKMVMVK